MLTVILGGTRSGKSARGEALAAASGKGVRYVATADPRDHSLRERIAAHQARRSAEWETVEAGDLAAAVADGECVLIDGLGPWLGALLQRGGGRSDALTAAAAVVAASAEREVIVVAEEAGQGLLPMDALSREWLDLLGDVTQRLSAAAARVELVVAGRPLVLTVAAAAAEPRVHGDQLVRPGDADHAVNVLAGGPPRWLQDAIAVADVTRYPDEREACAALAGLHDREPTEIVPTNGAAHALWLLPVALRPALAACVHPAFSEGETALRAHGVPIARVLRRPEDDFALPEIPAAADLVLLGNPASPSGTLDAAAAIRALQRPGRTIVVDEAFMDLVPGEAESLVRERHDDVIVIRSLTKAFAIPGLRAGYAVAAPPLAQRLRAARPPWSVNAPALAALTAVARRPESLALNAQRAQRERLDLQQRLTEAGITTWTATANYLLIEQSGAAAKLRAVGIAVRPAASFPGLTDDHVRITARDPASNARLVEALTA